MFAKTCAFYDFMHSLSVLHPKPSTINRVLPIGTIQIYIYIGIYIYIYGSYRYIAII